jgi:hypothetical protein
LLDSKGAVLGLGAFPRGSTSPQVRRTVTDSTTATDVVGVTIAEFFPCQVKHFQQILRDFPLISYHAAEYVRLASQNPSNLTLIGKLGRREP